MGKSGEQKAEILHQYKGKPIRYSYGGSVAMGKRICSETVKQGCGAQLEKVATSWWMLCYGSALSPLFMMVMDVLTIKQSEKEVPELMMFADDV